MAGRRILIFADGTGNEGGLLPEERQTNVYKLYAATRIRPHSPIKPDEQLAFYVNGIGTPEPGAPLPGRLRRKLMSLEQGLVTGCRSGPSAATRSSSAHGSRRTKSTSSALVAVHTSFGASPMFWN